MKKNNFKGFILKKEKFRYVYFLIYILVNFIVYSLKINTMLVKSSD